MYAIVFKAHVSFQGLSVEFEDTFPNPSFNLIDCFENNMVLGDFIDEFEISMSNCLVSCQKDFADR